MSFAVRETLTFAGMMMRKTQQGVTLTEILIALVLLAILAIAITPNYQTYLIQNNLKSVAEKLYSDFLLARSTALSTNTATFMRFNLGNPWCYGITNSALPNCNCNSAPSSSNCNLGETSSSAFPNTSLSDTGLTAHTVTFETVHGMLQGLPGSITITGSNGVSITVSINKLGIPSICSNTVGGYAGC